MRTLFLLTRNNCRYCMLPRRTCKSKKIVQVSQAFCFAVWLKTQGHQNSSFSKTQQKVVKTQGFSYLKTQFFRKNFVHLMPEMNFYILCSKKLRVLFIITCVAYVSLLFIPFWSDLEQASSRPPRAFCLLSSSFEFSRAMTSFYLAFEM